MDQSANPGEAMKSFTLPDERIVSPEMYMAATGSDTGHASTLALEDINPANPHLFRDHSWHDHFARLRNEDPVHLNETPAAGRYWSVTKYDDVRTVDGDWQTYSSTEGIVLTPPIGSDNQFDIPELADSAPFIEMDPPRHTAQRKTVRSVAAPANLRTLEPIMRARTIEVLDQVPDGEPFDWVETVSVELTTLMLATLFDFPLQDRSKLSRWSDIVFAVPEPGGVVETIDQKMDELMECGMYFGGLWADRLENPGDDLLSMLAHGEATKDVPFIHHFGNLMLLIVGGNDTTRNTMTGSVYGLDKYPAQFEKLVAAPALMTSMVPEIIRWQTPLSYMCRVATQDTELGGKSILKDDQVLMWYLSANRDEDVFIDADAIDIERANADRHLSFGYGIHFCMGSRLAEMQLRVLWEEILPRFKRIEVLAEPERTFSSFVNGYANLPVRVSRRTS